MIIIIGCLFYIFDNKWALSNPPMILILVSNTETLMFASKSVLAESKSTTL